MLKDGRKDIITIKSNGNKQTYPFAVRFCSSKSNSGSRCGVQIQRIISPIFLPTTPGRTKSSPDQENSRKGIFVRQLAMFNMGSLSKNLKCLPTTSCHLLSSRVTFANEEQDNCVVVTRLPPHRGLQDSHFHRSELSKIHPYQREGQQ